MEEDLHKNTFAALFPSVEAAQQYRQSQTNSSTLLSINVAPKVEVQDLPKVEKCNALAKEDKDVELDCLLEFLLLCTAEEVPANTSHACVRLPDSPVSVDSLDTVLFERLMLQPPFDLVSPVTEGLMPTYHWGAVDVQAVKEERVLYFLVNVYERCATAKKKIKSNKSLDHLRCVEALKDHVVLNFHTAVHEPDIYVNQDVLAQFKELLLNKWAECDVFDELVERYLVRADAEQTPLPAVFSQVLSEVERCLKESELMAVDWLAVKRLHLFCRTPSLAILLLTVPTRGSLATGPQMAGSAYEATALGRLLAISALPATPGLPSSFFADSSRLTRQEVDAVNASIASTQAIVHDRTFEIISTLLKNKSTREKFLKWLEGCLSSNVGRAGLWHVAGGEALATGTQYVSDGFMLSLGAVLARLAHKFTESVVTLDMRDQSVSQLDIMKVDPSYCVSGKGRSASELVPGSYPATLETLTTLIPPAEGEAAPLPLLPQRFTFVTSCFFFAHTALHLGIGVTVSRLERLQRDLNRLHRESNALGRDAEAGLRRLLRERVTLLTSSYLTLRAALLPHANSPPTSHLLAATAHWLVQIAQIPMTSAWDSCLRLSTLVQTPIPETVDQDPVPPHQSWLQFVPEMLVDNIARLATLYRMLNVDDNTPLFDLPVNKRYITFIIAFMGSSSRIKNPYLRAQLAQTLEVLLLGEPLSSASDIERTSRFASQLPAVWQQLVEQHPLAHHLVPSVLRVFVSIEMTGQNVAFEDKFKYRGPMYEILKHLWQVPEQRAVLVTLAEEALGSMESTKPPLLLRFVNLLINDNIFLLDEGLTYMMQLREMTLQKDGGEWESLPRPARQEKEQMLLQTGMMARFHNVLARRTSATLLMLTEEHQVALLLCHRTMVERVAHMLNFFLDQLVGPKQRQLKVRDAEQYEFQPGVMVAIICRMYCNLTQLPLFPGAVISDGRSYSPKLLHQARSVLLRIGEFTVAEHMETVQARVEATACEQQEEEDLTAAAPPHFLDPILSVLMRDPVKLPSSEVVVERSTIARHLLSDQSDPFNRQPLTMDQHARETNLTKLDPVHHAALRLRTCAFRTSPVHARETNLIKLDPVHHAALRPRTGAFRTSPVASLWVEGGEPPLLA
ncbi:Ubiquitin conjugation factor E4 core [Trinorchestia longiramus]|nr:Ubiquitin conjugation factor E4 core [Trinorchestia longiramus]